MAILILFGFFFSFTSSVITVLLTTYREIMHCRESPVKQSLFPDPKFLMTLENTFTKTNGQSKSFLFSYQCLQGKSGSYMLSIRAANCSPEQLHIDFNWDSFKNQHSLQTKQTRLSHRRHLLSLGTLLCFTLKLGTCIAIIQIFLLF